MTSEITQHLNCPHCNERILVTIPKKTVFTNQTCPQCRQTISIINNKGTLETNGSKL